MNPITRTLRRGISPGTAIVLLMLLSFAGSTWAYFPPDGTKPPGGPPPYVIPGDGICVIGIKADGTMLVDWSIKNARDCASWTRSADGTVNLAGMTTQAPCVNATNPVVAPNDGYRHAWSTSLCYDAVNQRGISRVDLDNTDAMCSSKGGTIVTTGKCVAFGWQYLNRKADGTLPVTGTGIGTTQGPAYTDQLGFCYTTVNLTQIAGSPADGTFTSAQNCPSRHNSNVITAAEWPACASSLTGCQTQASYDAGLGWSFTSNQCRYTYGQHGRTTGTITRADGTTIATGTVVDLSTPAYDTMGECLGQGFSWDNWLPNSGTSFKDIASGGDYAGMPSNTRIFKLDALTNVEDGGGGAFYSGTGAVCEKCHSDQSRSYQERNKPGYVETRHKLAGDAVGAPFRLNFESPANGGTSPWGLTGVQCSMCHSTGKPAQDDLIQVQPAGYSSDPTPNASCTAANAPYTCCTGAGTGTCTVNRLCTAAGNPYVCCTGSQAGTCLPILESAPKSAAGHNNTEYGTHLIDVCYTCHGTAATPSTVNPASVIPSTTTDFLLTAKGLAPIANQFLNSPHAQYAGSSTKVDIGNKTRYGSTFEGWVCRSPATQFRNNAAPGDTQANCQAAGLSWYTANGGYCYYNAANCVSVGGGSWSATFDASAYSWAGTSNGPQGGTVTPNGVCYGIGVGSILTTAYQNGVAVKVPNVDSTSNPTCTNPADGSATSGAAGYWVRDGETSPGTPALTDQGNCMTCHDVHWALASTNPDAEPLRRECTTCHTNSGTSASGAPQVDVTMINHLASAGTPLADMLTHPDDACETCHMPKSSAGASHMHLFRINPSSTYQTMGAGQANTSADGDYPNAAWVDIDHACGQCHYTSGVLNAGSHPTWPVFTRGQLAVAAKGMHPATGTTNPPPQSTQTCASTPAQANNWTVTLTDTSPNQSLIARESVNWGDGSPLVDDRTSPFGPYTYAYRGAGTYTINHLIVDTVGQVAQSTCNVTWSYFTIGGTVTDSRNTCVGGATPGAACTVDADCPGSVTPPLPAGTCTGAANTAPVAGAAVRVTSNANGLVAGNGITAANGTYTVGSLGPGTYTVTFSKAGYLFTTPAAVNVGPSASAVNSVGTVSLRAVKPPKINPKAPPSQPIGTTLNRSVR